MRKIKEGKEEEIFADTKNFFSVFCKISKRLDARVEEI